MAKTMDDFWIRMGWYRDIYDRPWYRDATSVRVLKFGKWKENWVRQEAVRFLVEEVLRKDPRDVNHSDFEKNGLRGLFTHYYRSSPYKAMREAGYKIKPWEMLVTPMGFFRKRNNRIAAVRWLIRKLKKDPRDVTNRDFRKNRLRGLLSTYYNDSPYKALKEAGYDIYPWELLFNPRGFFKKKENRIIAVGWLVKKLGKEPEEITQKDFKRNRLGGFLNYFYNESPYGALKEACYDVKPWKMKKTPVWFYAKRKNRIALIRLFVKKLGKDITEIKVDDFYKNGLWGFLSSHYNGCVYEALRDAGLVKEEHEAWLDRKRGLRIEQMKERIIDYIKKYPNATANEIRKAGLATELHVVYGNRTNHARKDAGVVITRQVLPLEIRRQRVLKYIKRHPKATPRDLIKAGLRYDLSKAYHNRINDARKDVGIIRETRLKKRLFNFIRGR